MNYFLARLQNVRRASICFVMSARLCACNNSAPAGRIFVKFYIWVFFEYL